MSEQMSELTVVLSYHDYEDDVVLLSDGKVYVFCIVDDAASVAIDMAKVNWHPYISNCKATTVPELYEAVNAMQATYATMTEEEYKAHLKQ